MQHPQKKQHLPRLQRHKQCVRHAEYRSGHIPGAVNVPSEIIESVRKKIPDPDTPVFAYCLSGARSSKAVSAMKKMGYTNVRNIGGINRYRGEQE